MHVWPVLIPSTHWHLVVTIITITLECEIFKICGILINTDLLVRLASTNFIHVNEELRGFLSKPEKLCHILMIVELNFKWKMKDLTRDYQGLIICPHQIACPWLVCNQLHMISRCIQWNTSICIIHKRIAIQQCWIVEVHGAEHQKMFLVQNKLDKMTKRIMHNTCNDAIFTVGGQMNNEGDFVTVIFICPNKHDAWYTFQQERFCWATGIGWPALLGLQSLWSPSSSLSSLPVETSPAAAWPSTKLSAASSSSF